MSAQIIPVIMCGGAGTRLWPVSRESMPKQFVPLIGQRSTFQQVLARISDPALFARPIVITNADFRFVVAEQLRERGIEADIVLEPMPPRFRPGRRGRRRACGRARSATPWCWCSRPTMSFASPKNFTRACRSAAAAAAEGPHRDLRHRAHRPATSYGYIRPGSKLNGGCRARGRRLRREARRRDRRDLCRRQLSLEQRQLPVPRRDDAERDRALRAGDGGGREGARSPA